MLDDTLTIPRESRFDALNSGVIIGGNYRIIEKIGCGGMGTVYLAEDTGPLKRRCAVKVLDRTMAGKSGHGRFLDEAQIMASLRHPNIVPVTHFGTDADTGLDYYVMDEFMPTREERHRICSDILHCRVPKISGDSAPLTLAQLLDGGISLPEESAISVALQLLSAMEAAHKLSPPVVHRDIKPSNILFAPDGRAMLSDFGIAKRLANGDQSHEWTAPNATPGTWSFSAPEQRNGGTISIATDFYAFGLVLFKMLTGGMPNKTAALPVDIAKLVSKSWQPLFAALLEQDPARRLANAVTVRSTLENILAASQRRSTHGKALSFAHRIVIRATFAAFIVAVVAVGISFMIMHSRAKDSQDLVVQSTNSDSPAEIAPQVPAATTTLENAPFPHKEWAAKVAKSFRENLAKAIVNPSCDSSGKIIVPKGKLLFSGDIPSDIPDCEILLDGGTLFFAPSREEVTALAEKFEYFAANAPEDAESPDLPPSTTIVFSTPVSVSANGGYFNCIEGEMIAPNIVGHVSRADDVTRATLDVFGFSSITLNRKTLDSGLDITGCGRIADISDSGEISNLSWFDYDSPLP